MVLKDVFIAILCTMLLAWSGSAIADEYRADEFLGLDLSKALLSPKRLGPESEFAPVAIEASTDRSNEGAQARVEPKAQVNATIAVAGPSVRNTRVAQVRAAKQHGAVRTKLVHHHGNPLDAQARDTRIQAWPCKSGGICNWK